MSPLASHIYLGIPNSIIAPITLFCFNCGLLACLPDCAVRQGLSLLNGCQEWAVLQNRRDLGKFSFQEKSMHALSYCVFCALASPWAWEIEYKKVRNSKILRLKIMLNYWNMIFHCNDKGIFQKRWGII